MAIVSPPRCAPAPSPSSFASPFADPALARRLLGMGLALMVAALLWLSWTEYALPPGYQAAYWGLNPLAVTHWADHLHFALPPPLPAPRWNAQFRGGLALLWLGYGLLACAARRAAPSRKTTLIITAGLASVVAVLMPPLLSTDSYAYAATGRLAVLYGQNPYVALPITVLHKMGDPAQFFLAWDIPTVYGPIWTGLVVALVGGLPHGWLWGEVLCMKLVEAGALCLLAWSAGHIAEHYQPGRGKLGALLAGACPLLLLEGAGSGHNDLLMMACLFTAVALFLRGKHGGAGLWLGLAVGIKLLPLVLLPWLLWDVSRTLPDPRARRRAMFQLVFWMLLPLILGYACFWHGGAAWEALHRRTQMGHGTFLWAGLAYAALSAWLWTRKPAPAPAPGARKPAPAPWLAAWMVFSGVFMMTGLGIAFPWYLCWLWPAMALSGERIYRPLFAAVFVFALFWESLYATLLPLSAFAGR